MSADNSPVDVAHGDRRQLGQLMVEEGLLSVEGLEHALAEQQRTSRPLGELLVELGYVSPGAVANALAEQHGGLLKTEYGISFGLQRPPAEPAPVADASPEPVAELRVVRGEEAEPQPEPQQRLAQPLSTSPTTASEAPVAAAAEPQQAAEATSDRITELEAELALREAKLANVVGQATARLGEARTQLEAATVEQETLTARVRELEAQLASLPSRAAPDPEAEAEVARLRDAYAALDAQVREQQAERGSLAARVHELEAQLASLPAEPETVPDPETEAALARLRVAYQTLEQELEGARAAASRPDPQLHAELERLQAEGVELRAALAEAGRSAGRSAEAAAELQAVTVQRDALEARLVELGDSLAVKVGELAAQSESIAALEAESARSREVHDADLGRAASELQELRVSLAEREAELAAARRAVEDAVAAAPEPTPSLQLELDRLRAELARAENRLGRAQTEAEYYRATLSQRDDELAEASVVSRRAGERAARLEAELEHVQARLTDTEQRLVAATLDLARIEAEEQHSRTEAGRVGGLASELATLRDQLDRKDVELAAATLRAEHANERSGELEADVAGLRRELTDRDSRLAQAVAETAWLEQELEAKVAAEAVDEDSHQLFVPSAGGYSLLDRDGTAPKVGDVVELEDGRFVVAKRARSPLPGIRSLCAYLARV